MLPKVLVLTPCSPSKKCAVCIARMTQATQYYGSRVVAQATTAQLVMAQDIDLSGEDEN